MTLAFTGLLIEIHLKNQATSFTKIEVVPNKLG